MRPAGCFSASPLLVLMWHVLLPSGAGAQGQLVFDNHVNNVVVAPVYGLDPAHPTMVQRGNSGNGYPAGAQSYAASPLGAGYTAQLFGGPARFLQRATLRSARRPVIRA